MRIDRLLLDEEPAALEEIPAKAGVCPATGSSRARGRERVHDGPVWTPDRHPHLTGQSRG